MEAAAGPGGHALANNRYSADVVAISRAADLAGLPPLPADNALPRWLEERAGVAVTDLRSRWRLGVDIDTPLDLIVLRDPAARGLLATAPLIGERLAALADVMSNRRAELLVAGRVSATTLKWLERGVACRVRALVEERGLRAASRLAQSGAVTAARPPRSILGELLDRDGPESLAARVARLADAAVVDTRVLMATSTTARTATSGRATDSAWPGAEDRFASDLLLPASIADPWLRAAHRFGRRGPLRPPDPSRRPHAGQRRTPPARGASSCGGPMTPERRPPATERRRRPTPRSPSEPSAEGAGRSAELAALIRAEIESSPDRRITFARYMERALYEPGPRLLPRRRRPPHRRRRLPDRARDARHLRLDRRPPDRGDVGGAGSPAAVRPDRVRRRIGHAGALDPRRAAPPRRRSASCSTPIRYEPVESNPNRLADLRRQVRKGRPDLRAPGSRAGSLLPDRGRAVPVTGVILANEFLDALPVHRVVVRGGKLLELFVTWNAGGGDGGGPGGGGFAEVAAEPSTPELAARLADDGVEPAEGQVAEICLGLGPVARASRRPASPAASCWPSTTATTPPSCTALAASPARCSGIAAIASETDPFAAPGQIDLTAHVDFTAVRALAARRGFRTVSLDHAVGVPRRRRPGGRAARPPGLAGPDPRRLHPRPFRASSACSTRATWAASAS